MCSSHVLFTCAFHRCSDLVGRPCSIRAIRFHAPSFTPLPTAALYLKRSRQGGAASSAQLDRRVAYDGSGRLLVGEIAAKQKRNHWSSWEWCEGATTALVNKELLKPRVMSAALKGALGTAHDGARREPIRLPDDPAGQVAAAGQPPTPPPCTEWPPAAADEPAPGTAPTPGTAPVAAGAGTTESVVRSIMDRERRRGQWSVGHKLFLTVLLSREAQRVSKSPLVGRNADIKLLRRRRHGFNFCGGWSCVLSGERLQPIRS
jgi:hypothetical protein